MLPVMLPSAELGERHTPVPVHKALEKLGATERQGALVRPATAPVTFSPVRPSTASGEAPTAAPVPVLRALEKLDQRATERQGARELRSFLGETGGAALTSLVPALLKNLRRKLGVVASSECVAILAECFETEPAACAPLLSKMVVAAVTQMGRGDARQREACATALGRVAAATSGCPPVEGGPAFGPVANQRLAVLLAPLLTSLADPNAVLQEGASSALLCVLARADSSDVAASMPVLVPRLVKTMGASLAPQAAFLALAATLEIAPRDLVVAAAAPAVAAIVKVLGSSDHRARTSAARAALPLLRSLYVDVAAGPGESSAMPSIDATVAPLRKALDGARYDRVTSVRAAVTEASAMLPKKAGGAAAAPAGVAAAGAAAARGPASARGPRPLASRPGTARTFARARQPNSARSAGSEESADVVLFKPPPPSTPVASPAAGEALCTPGSAISDGAEAPKEDSPLLIAPSPLPRSAQPTHSASSPLEPLRQSSDNEARRKSNEPKRVHVYNKVGTSGAAAATPQRCASPIVNDIRGILGTPSSAMPFSARVPEMLASPLQPSLLASFSIYGAVATPAPVQADEAVDQAAELPLGGEEEEEVKENLSPTGERAASLIALTPSKEPRVLQVLSEDESASGRLEEEDEYEAQLDETEAADAPDGTSAPEGAGADTPDHAAAPDPREDGVDGADTAAPPPTHKVRSPDGCVYRQSSQSCTLRLLGSPSDSPAPAPLGALAPPAVRCPSDASFGSCASWATCALSAASVVQASPAPILSALSSPAFGAELAASSAPRPRAAAATKEDFSIFEDPKTVSPKPMALLEQKLARALAENNTLRAALAEERALRTELERRLADDSRAAGVAV